MGTGPAVQPPVDPGDPIDAIDTIDAIGRVADVYVKALLLDERGLDHHQIGRRLQVEPEAVPMLLRIARTKLAELAP